MKKILVLGGTGMLGSMVTQVLAKNRSFSVTATTRGERPATDEGGVRWEHVDVAAGTVPPGLIERHAWVVNAIGITKPLIHDDNAGEIARAVNVNVRLPQAIAEAANRTGCRVIQIATDCVYSGARGQYLEADAHDALDVYGKTKSLGETYEPSAHHLRCSIIGPEAKDFKFLLEWFRGSPSGARVNGFRNHHWNGVTTLQFAKLCAGIIEHDLPLGHLQHVVPADVVTKADLLALMGNAYGRDDINISVVDAKAGSDRTLATSQAEGNARLWKAAGYESAPTIHAMLRELAAFPFQSARPVAG